MSSKQDVITQFENLLEQYRKKLLTLADINRFVIIVKEFTTHNDYADVLIEDYNELEALIIALSVQKIISLLDVSNFKIYIPALHLLIIFRPRDLRELYFKLPPSAKDKYSHLI